MSPRKIYNGILTGCGGAAAAAILFIVLLVSLNIFLRKFLQTSIPWTIEVCEYALYFATFMAAPWVLAKNAHIRVDVFTSFLDAHYRRYLNLFVDLIGLGTSLVFLVYGIQATYASWTSNALVFKELIVPEWRLLLIIPISFFLLSLEFFIRLTVGLRSKPEAS